MLYNDRLQRVNIPVMRAGYRVNGQVFLDLSVDEAGRLNVLSMTEVLNVFPEEQKNRLLTVIETRFNAISFVPPRDKDEQPVRFKWRLTYKVGKLGKNIILIKQ
jgi:hypothetical protein